MSNKKKEQALLRQTTVGYSCSSYADIAQKFDLWAYGGSAPSYLPISYSRTHFCSYNVDAKRFNYRAPDELAALVLSLLQNRKDMRTVLDIGCGTGLVGEPFLERGYTVDGIDISSAMMEHARETGYRNLTQHNVATTPLETTLRYDAAISVGVLGEYVPPDVAVTNVLDALQNRAVIGVAGEMTKQGISKLQNILRNEGFQRAHFHVGIGYQHSCKTAREYAYMLFTRKL